MTLGEFKTRYRTLTITSFDMPGLADEQDLDFGLAFANDAECRAWYIKKRLDELAFDHHRF